MSFQPTQPRGLEVKNTDQTLRLVVGPSSAEEIAANSGTIAGWPSRTPEERRMSRRIWRTKLAHVSCPSSFLELEINKGCVWACLSERKHGHQSVQVRLQFLPIGFEPTHWDQVLQDNRQRVNQRDAPIDSNGFRSCMVRKHPRKKPDSMIKVRQLEEDPSDGNARKYHQNAECRNGPTEHSVSG